MPNLLGPLVHWIIKSPNAVSRHEGLQLREPPATKVMYQCSWAETTSLILDPAWRMLSISTLLYPTIVRTQVSRNWNPDVNVDIKGGNQLVSYRRHTGPNE